MSYELTDLVTIFRQDMMDQVEPYLWSDAEIYRYLAQAQDYFLENTEGIADSLPLTYSAGDLTVAVPEYVLRVRLAYDADEKALLLKNKLDWDIERSGFSWRSETGAPNTIITDLKSKTVRLYPIPLVDGGFTLDIFRTAITTPEDEEELEVTDRNAQRIIMVGVRALGYQKEDPETLDETKAMKYQLMFETKVDDFYARIQNARRRSRPVTYGGII